MAAPVRWKHTSDLASVLLGTTQAKCQSTGPWEGLWWSPDMGKQTNALNVISWVPGRTARGAHGLHYMGWVSITKPRTPL